MKAFDGNGLGVDGLDALHERTEAPAVDRRARSFVVVAHRLPVQAVRRAGSVQWRTSPGGLVAALVPALRRTRGTWIGWHGWPGDAPSPFVESGIAHVPVALSKDEVHDYYEGFANGTLWPLYHDRVRQPQFRREWWEPYVQVNRRFAEAADAWAEPHATVWVHDYHLQLVPAMLRARRPDVRIGFFLHIPFPPVELFQQLPWRRRLLEGLLGADVIGFQTRVGAENFARLVRRHVGADVRDARIEYEDRSIVYGGFPISIDFERYSRAARDACIVARAEQIKRRLGRGRKVLLGIDRLDYTKGIGVRLEAFGELLAEGRVDAADCVLVQVAVPSRERVPEYRSTRESIERLVGEINGAHGSIGRPVVHYLYKSLPFEEVVALYVAADVMLVTALRDGMNLVAKEYVAARPDERGALVLSEFIGAAQELQSALIVNPHDVDGLTAATEHALRLPVAEQQWRMRAMRQVVRAHDVYAWARSFLRELELDPRAMAEHHEPHEVGIGADDGTGPATA